MFRLQESHSQQNQLGLYDFGLALLNHNGATTFWVWLPVYLLNFYACQLAILAQELKGIDVPTACATFLVTRCSLECARPIWPWVLRILWPLNRLRHNLNLGNTLTSLTMGSSYTVRTSITTTDDEYILTLGGNALILRELHTSQHAILL